jgi:hypothetical protein
MTETNTRIEHTGLLVATFGKAKLVQLPTGRYELVNAGITELLEAREWASLFMPEVVIRGNGCAITT